MAMNKSINMVLFYFGEEEENFLNHFSSSKKFSLHYPQSSRSVDPQSFVCQSSRQGATLRRKVICSILGDNYSQNSSTRESKFVLRRECEFVELGSIYIYVFLFCCVDNFHNKTLVRVGVCFHVNKVSDKCLCKTFVKFVK